MVLCDGGLIQSSALSAKEGAITAPSADEETEAHSREAINLNPQG